ncbi:S8 family peptidase [Lacihabitans lacunae]|uniref:S8 family peptidase n=1 Tax=Lacihabitans lacunae TaxID=1028214 RepID=A0ABV7YTY9_9BACT
MRFVVLLFSILIFQSSALFGQNTYFVYLKDKAQNTYSLSAPEKFLSERSINRRIRQQINLTQRDLPVSDKYISDIKSLGIKVIYSSKWLNAVLVETSSANLPKLLALSFVKNIESNSDIKGARVGAAKTTKEKWETEVNYDYGTSLNQITMLGADQMHKDNLTGKEILVAILDGGFQNADQMAVFDHIFKQNKLIDKFDFVARNSNVFDDHNHGTNVLSCIAAKSEGNLIGTAPDVKIALYRTEDVFTETRIEEVYWLLGAERADSVGADVINSSLGYSQFDNAAQNYVNADMNGDKTICAKAADFAVATGMLVVVSAGNDGNSPWRYIATPADADSVISVGAVDQNGLYASFSSVGPNAKNNIKPELAAKGLGTKIATPQGGFGTSNGTSFASPLLAGFAASLWQDYQVIPVMKFREILIESGKQYKSPDNILGYGIPQYQVAKKLADEYIKSLVLAKSAPETNTLKVYPNPSSYRNPIRLEINNIEIANNETVEVININGIRVGAYTYAELNANPIFTQSGTYLFKIKREEKIYTIKHVVE